MIFETTDEIALNLAKRLKKVSKIKKITQYDDDWIVNGFSISPFSLPLKKVENNEKRIR